MNPTTNLKLYDAQQIINGIGAIALIAIVLALAYIFLLKRPIVGKKIGQILAILAIIWSLCYAGQYYISAQTYLNYRKEVANAQNRN